MCHIHNSKLPFCISLYSSRTFSITKYNVSSACWGTLRGKVELKNTWFTFVLFLVFNVSSFLWMTVCSSDDMNLMIHVITADLSLFQRASFFSEKAGESDLLYKQLIWSTSQICLNKIKDLEIVHILNMYASL